MYDILLNTDDLINNIKTFKFMYVCMTLSLCMYVCIYVCMVAKQSRQRPGYCARGPDRGERKTAFGYGGEGQVRLTTLLPYIIRF
jgi:hypothetical protein